MTEYDYSPEAYERYLATQNRIANWVNNTEQNRPQFEHPFQASAPAPAGPSMRPGLMSHDSRQKSKPSPPPSPTHHYPQQFAHSQQPRQLFVHPPESDSSDEYGEGPGPMPLPSPGMVFPPQQPAFHPMAQPMMQPPSMMMPPTYMAAPYHKSSHHHNRSSHSHSRSRSHQPTTYYSVASPPVSPGYQYAYPQMMGGGHPGYFMMPPQPYPHSGRQIPVMYLT
jgi:hypothetical protein